MNRPPRFRFSLRRFLLVCACMGVVLALLIRAFVAHNDFQKSISRVGHTSGFCGFNLSHDIVNVGFYDNHQGEPVAVLLCVYDFDCEIPEMTHKYRYDLSRGGVLVVDGNRVIPTGTPRMFVNGPYGHTVELSLDGDQASKLFAVAKGNVFAWREYWQKHVEPRLYDLDGASYGALRDGLWTYRLKNGAKYMDANYKLGERDGPWTTYYPNGTVRARRWFKEGKPIGTWEYFDSNGVSLGAITYEEGVVPGGSKRNSGSSGSSQSVAGASYERNDRGGVFKIRGHTVPRPDLPE